MNHGRILWYGECDAGRCLDVFQRSEEVEFQMNKIVAIIGWLVLVLPASGQAQVLDKDALLARETWWDNQDFDWYKENIPFFECPDEEIQTTYYYRWELLTKHLT